MSDLRQHDPETHKSQYTSSGREGLIYLCALLLCGLLACCLLFVATQSGMGISSDSIAYIGVSEHLATGKGLNWISGDGSLRPMTHFPPLYPLLLAGVQNLGLNVISAARLINILAFGGSVFFVGWFILRLSGHHVVSIAGSLFTACSPIMIYQYSVAMTEPVYILLMLFGVWFLARFLNTHRIRFIIASGIAVGLTYVTRYAGLSLVIAVAIVTLLERRSKRSDKVRNLAMLIAMSLTPIMIWIGRNLILAGTFTNRRMVWHPPSWSKLKGAFAVVWEWLTPYEFSYPALYAMIFILLLVIVISVYRLCKSGHRAFLCAFDNLRKNDLLMILVSYVVCYSLIILITMALFDASTPMDTRITLPLYVPILILMFTLIARWLPRWKGKLRSGVVLLVGGILLVSYIARSIDLIQEIRVNPKGYVLMSQQQLSYETEIRSLSPEVEIYTNDIERLYFVFGQYGHRTPIRYDQVTTLDRATYEQELTQMREMLMGDRAVLVLFHTNTREIPAEWIRGLQLRWQSQGIAIYVDVGFNETVP